MRRTAVALEMLLLTVTAAAGAQVPQWQPQDFAFQAQTNVENPFLTGFSARITAPDGRAFIQPGFYDGNHTWKVRVAASQAGSWSLVTRSELPELDGKGASFTCVVNTNSKVHGALKVDAAHPHHFVFEDGTRFFLLGYECDWLWALTMTNSMAGALGPFLDRIAAHGFDYIILNSYAYDTPWRHPGRTGPDDFGPPPLLAWEGSNEKPDHSRPNLAYWQDFDQTIQALYERGLMAHIMIKVYNKKVNWPERKSPSDDLYFRWLAARYAAYPNVIWDFAKEAQREHDLDYKLDRLRFLRAHDPYHRLVTVNDDDVNNDAGAYDALNDFRCDQQHSKFRQKILVQHRRRDWPVVNIEYGYEQAPNDTEEQRIAERAQPAEELVSRAWEINMGGGYAGYYYVETGWDVIRPLSVPKGYAYYKLLRDFFESTRYWELTPAENISSDGWALADEGREYVVFLKQARPFTLNVNCQDELKAEWFQPLTGRRAPAGTVKSGPRQMNPPDGWQDGMAVLHVGGGVR